MTIFIGMGGSVRNADGLTGTDISARIVTHTSEHESSLEANEYDWNGNYF
jgi:hypothetical protein